MPQCHSMYGIVYYTVVTVLGYTDPNGTFHSMNIQMHSAQMTPGCNITQVNSGSATATDGSGLKMSATVLSFSTPISLSVTVTRADGTVIQNPGLNGATISDPSTVTA